MKIPPGLAPINPLIEPDWLTHARVLAFSSTRLGGYSDGSWKGLNFGGHVGDAPSAVTANRAWLQAQLPPGSQIQWLQQVHGTDVVVAGEAGDSPCADAVISRTPGLACAVMTADCLPVLFSDSQGTVVAAAHAGWRGLAAGVLEATVVAMQVEPSQLHAWLGPAIGPLAFEVGSEVRAAFIDHPLTAADAAAAFVPQSSRPGHFMADIYALARLRLQAAGLLSISGGGCCTFSDSRQFFSYRRDGQTGRMASLILLDPHLK